VLNKCHPLTNVRIDVRKAWWEGMGIFSEVKDSSEVFALPETKRAEGIHGGKVSVLKAALDIIWSQPLCIEWFGSPVVPHNL
jgi:hypothetical protein